MNNTIKALFCAIFLASLCLSTSLFAGDDPKTQKILICGVGRNIQGASKYTIRNIEALGEHFADYAVIIYENNSEDDTVRIYQKWAEENPRVNFVTETVKKRDQPRSREEKIARARNIVHSIARDPKYKDYKYLLMADLDFRSFWPINEILETIKSPLEWDCVSANGMIWYNGEYYDRHAFRDQRFPLGCELLGNEFWRELRPPESLWFKVRDDSWVRVDTAFGGMAIFKTETVLKYNYSGTVTEDLKRYYEKVIASLPSDHPHLQKYLKVNGWTSGHLKQIPLVFRDWVNDKKIEDSSLAVCCEHVPLQVAMALDGHDKIFINSRMVLNYEVQFGSDFLPIVKPVKDIKVKKVKKKPFWSFLKKNPDQS